MCVHALEDESSVLHLVAVICHAFLQTDKNLQLWTETEQDQLRLTR